MGHIAFSTDSHSNFSRPVSSSYNVTLILLPWEWWGQCSFPFSLGRLLDSGEVMLNDFIGLVIKEAMVSAWFP